MPLTCSLPSRSGQQEFLCPREIATTAVTVQGERRIKVIIVATIVTSGCCDRETTARRTLPLLAEGCCAGFSLSFLCPAFSPLFPCGMRSSSVISCEPCKHSPVHEDLFQCP